MKRTNPWETYLPVGTFRNVRSYVTDPSTVTVTERSCTRLREKLLTSILCFYVQALAANGVAVVRPVFISYLVTNTRPKGEDYLVEEFLPYWNTMNTVDDDNQPEANMSPERFPHT